MKTIYKFPLHDISDFMIIDMPRGARMIHAREQHGVACVWALVDTEEPVVKRQIRVVGTGQPAGDVLQENYIGSALLLNGTYLWHIFDAGEILN